MTSVNYELQAIGGVTLVGGGCAVATTQASRSIVSDEETVGEK